MRNMGFYTHIPLIFHIVNISIKPIKKYIKEVNYFMDFNYVNVGIVIFIYILVELVKAFCLKTNEQKKAIPLLCIAFGAVLTCALYFIIPECFPSCSNFIEAFGMGGLSGASATGCNQVYRQFTKYKTFDNIGSEDN